MSGDAATGPAAGAATWRERLTDWPNAVVVKELRQAVNGRFTGAVLTTLLVLQVAIIALTVVVGDVSRFQASRGMGRELFALLQGTLLFATTLAMPLYVGVRAMAERSGNQLDLLYVTTLPAHQIVAGKLQAGVLLTGLVYVASLPLMSLCYLLRGVDLPSMAAVVAGSFMLVVNAIVLALAAGCLPLGRALRVIFAFAFVALVLAATSATTALAGLAISAGIGSSMGTWSFWRTVAVVVALDLLALRLLFLVTVAMVAPPSANRALPVRRFLLVVWAATLAAAVAAGHALSSSGPLQAWLLTAVWGAAPLLLAAASGRDRPSPAVSRALPRRPWARALAFPLFSGAANGFAFALIWLLATLLVAHGAERLLPAGVALPAELARSSTILAAYLVGYASAGAMLARGPLRRRLKPNQSWVVALALAGLGGTLPPLVGLLVDREVIRSSENFGAWLALSPGAAFRTETIELAATVAWGWAALVLLGGARWWARQWGATMASSPAPAVVDGASAP
jgi:hypothetical protein